MSAEGKMSNREHVLVLSGIVKVVYLIQVKFLFLVWASSFQVLLLYIQRLSQDIKKKQLLSL